MRRGAAGQCIEGTITSSAEYTDDYEQTEIVVDRSFPEQNFQRSLPFCEGQLSPSGLASDILWLEDKDFIIRLCVATIATELFIDYNGILHKDSSAQNLGQDR